MLRRMRNGLRGFTVDSTAASLDLKDSIAKYYACKERSNET
jgi:hypothetical protein